MTDMSGGGVDRVLAASQPVQEIIPLRRLYWSLRRELWENRSVYLVPMAAAAVFLVAFLFRLYDLPARLAAAADPNEVIRGPYSFAALLMMLSTLLVAIFYSLDALHAERRDRSILFFKSLPVSDLITVLAKGAVPILVLPLVAALVTAATQGIMLIFTMLRLAGTGHAGQVWDQVAIGQMWWMVFYHDIAIHGLWFAPLFGWLLLVSAWARRAPFLWATVPLLVIGIVEKVVFNTTYLARLLLNRISGAPEGVPFAGTSELMPHTHLPLLHFLETPGLWAGLAVTALFLAAAVRIRRQMAPL